MLWLLQPRTPQSEDSTVAAQLSGLLEALQDYSRNGLHQTVSLVYYGHGVAWRQAGVGYARLCQVFNASFGMAAELLLNEHNFAGLQGEGCCCAPITAASRGLDWRRMAVAMERGDRETFLNMLATALGVLRTIPDRGDPVALEIYYQCAAMLLSHRNRRNSGLPNLERVLRSDAHGDWAQAADDLLDMATALFRIQKGRQEKSIRDSVENIQRYVREHLGEDLSLVHLSEVFYFNPSYLSRLFKQSTGENLTDYICSLRVARAQQMLPDRRKRVGEIAAELGFESQHYFARFFKKATGLTPQEYREQAQRPTSEDSLDTSPNKAGNHV
jgi:two-component system response regulator YesN